MKARAAALAPLRGANECQTSDFQVPIRLAASIRYHGDAPERGDNQLSHQIRICSGVRARGAAAGRLANRITHILRERHGRRHGGASFAARPAPSNWQQDRHSGKYLIFDGRKKTFLHRKKSLSVLVSTPTTVEEVKGAGLQLPRAPFAVSPNGRSHNPNLKINQRGCNLVLLPQILSLRP